MMNGLYAHFFIFNMTDIKQLTEQALAGLDLELVELERAAGGLLVVTVDKPQGITIKDCEDASRLLSRVYEVENIDYKRLEVSSPGVDRPLKTLRDFNRFTGERVQVRLRQAVENQKVFTGELAAEHEVTDPADKAFTLACKIDDKHDMQLQFAFADVEKAKLDPVLNFKGKNK